MTILKLIASVTVLVGCAGEGQSNQPPVDGSTPPVDASVDAPVVDELPDLAGNWALRDILVTRTQVPVIGVTTSKTVSLLFTEFTKTAAGYDSSQRLCEVLFDSGNALATNTIGPNYVSTRPIRERKVEVTAPASFSQQSEILVEGAMLADDDTSPLPTTANDPAVIDDDNDNNPGFTMDLQIVGLGSQKIYLVQRSEIGLAGTIETTDRIAGGQTIARFESNVVGATSNTVIPDQSPVAVEAESTFTMVRLPSNASCSDISEQTEMSLFGARP